VIIIIDVTAAASGTVREHQPPGPRRWVLSGRLRSL